MTPLSLFDNHLLIHRLYQRWWRHYSASVWIFLVLLIVSHSKESTVDVVSIRDKASQTSTIIICTVIRDYIRLSPSKKHHIFLCVPLSLKYIRTWDIFFKFSIIWGIFLFSNYLVHYFYFLIIWGIFIFP